MQTTVRTALQLGPGVHVIRIRHASGGWFTLHPITVSAAQAMTGSAGGQAGAAGAELGILAERTPTPTLLSVSPRPATVGDTLSISGIINTTLGLGGAAAGASAAQATPLVLERSPTPILSSVSPNPATIGDVLTISGSVDGQLSVAGAAAGQASAVATITVGRSLAGAAAGAGGAAATGLTQDAPADGVTYVGGGTLTSGTYADQQQVAVPLPAGVQADDILIMLLGAGVYATPVPPAGWTQMTGLGGPFSTGITLWKRAGASESPPVFTATGSDEESFPVATQNAARIFAFRGCGTVGSPLDATPVLASGTGTVLTGSGLTTAAVDSMVVAIGGCLGSATYSSPGGSVDTVDTSASASGSVFCAYDDAPSRATGAQSAPTLSVTPAGAWAIVSVALRKAV